MSNFLPDQAQAKALASWYTENNPLRLNPRHPLIGMTEEAGELLGCFKKHNFKPNWNWFEKCECKHNKDRHDSYGCTSLHFTVTVFLFILSY